MKKQLSIVIAIILGVAVLGYLSFNKKQNTLATIGRHVISKSDLQDRLKTFPEQYQEQLKIPANQEKILNQMVEEELLMQAAKHEGIEQRKEITDKLEQAKKELILNTLITEKINNQVTITEEEVKAFFKQNEAQFNEVENRRVQHILVADEKLAESIRDRAKRGNNFGDLAKQYSTDPTGQNGGDLGWFGRGQLVPDFERAAYNLRSKGDISNVIKTQFGYHVIKLNDVRVRPKLSYEDVKEALTNQLLGNKRQIKSQEFLTSLKEQFKVKVNAEKLSPKKEEAAK